MAMQLAPTPAQGVSLETHLERQFALMRLLRPHDVPGMRMVRLGRDCDGGYVVPVDVLAKADACLSYGVGDDTSFEEDLLQACPGVRVHLFDHTIHGPPRSIPGLSFLREGICRADNQWLRGSRGQLRGVRVLGRGAFVTRTPPFIAHDRQVSLVTHLRRLDLTDRPIVVKMDVEGAEYDVIAATPRDAWRRVVCLVVEFHFLHRPEATKRAVECLAQLAESHVLVHVHGNNNQPMVAGPYGLAYPRVIELTFAHRRFADGAAISCRRFPGELDRPGQMDRPDLDLSFISSPVLATVPLDSRG